MDERWSEQKRQRDLDDLNNEAAGREVGRISRFHPERDPRYIEDKKKERERKLSALAQLLRDPEYAAAYQRVNEAIDRAQSALDTALLENAQITEDLTEQLDEMEANAARLPDGRAVFRAEDGSLRTADGQRLRSEAIPVELVIPADAPSYEDYAATREALRSARAHGQELSRVQTEMIDPARDRMNDQDNPPSREELEDIERQMNDVSEALERGELPAPVVENEATAPRENADLDLGDLPSPLR